jgi:myo-inositol 2-dehydrogenase/D-chiro-inositol 1-dehydrogenase
LTLRLGMAGAGWIADTHLQNAAAIPDVSIVSVADPDATRAQRVADAADATAYGDWESMLEREQLDGLIICTPPLVHRDPCLAAIDRGLHVYLEKPIARTRQDAEAIVRAAAGSGSVVAVGYQYRALDFLGDLVSVAQSDAVGLLMSYSVGATAGRRWFARQTEGGGQVLERASHHIDLQRAIAGEVEWVQAAGTQVALAGNDRPSGSDIDDVLTLTLGFRSRAIGSILVAWTSRSLPSAYTLDVVSAGAALHVDLDPAFGMTGVRDGAEVARTAQVHPMRRGFERFVEAVRRDEPSLVACDVVAAAGTLDVALACERALADDCRVPVAG